MPPEMRAQLEAVAKEHGNYLSEEILGRLRKSLLDEWQRQRGDPALRALTYLVSEAGKWASRMPDGLRRPDQPAVVPEWHRNPFLFAAFKAAVGKIFAALEPVGEIRPPFAPDELGRHNARRYSSPNRLAAEVARSVLYFLHDTKPPPDIEAHWAAITWMGPDGPVLGADLPEEMREVARRMTNTLRRYSYAMSNARRDLGIDKPKEEQS
jgi:hypothetical protein